MLQTIEEIPADLEDIYGRMMEQIRGMGKIFWSLAVSILATTTAAYRPLHRPSLVSCLHCPPDILTTYKSVAEIVNMCASRGAPHSLLERSLQAMSKILRRNIYQLSSPGPSIYNIEQPNPNPLTEVEYSSTYWVEHLCSCDPGRRAKQIRDNGVLSMWFCWQSFLALLEALGLLGKISVGIPVTEKLNKLLQVGLAYSQRRLL